MLLSAANMVRMVDVSFASTTAMLAIPSQRPRIYAVTSSPLG